MAKGTSGYLKKKGKTLKELNKALDTSQNTPADNAADEASRQMDRERDDYHGITDRIRNIFND